MVVPRWRISTAAETFQPSIGKAMTIPSPSFSHPPEATRLIFEIERSARDHFKADRVHLIQPAVLRLARSGLDMESVPEHEGDRNAKDQAKQDCHLDALLYPTELGGVCRELRRNQQQAAHAGNERND